MKIKNIITLSCLISGIGVTTFADLAQAVEFPTTTTAEVTFESNNAEGGKPVVPGPGPEEKPIIDPTGPKGNHTKGPLRIEHVPGISFGKQKISSTTEWYDVKWGLGKVGGSTEEVKIPQFAQVTDERGIKGSWNLTVQQETPFTNTTDATNQLTNSRIEIHEQQLFNTDVADASPLLDGVVGLSVGSSVDIPVGGNAIRVLSTKAGQHTDSSKSSVTFVSAQDYADDETFYETANQATLKDAHSGLKLRTNGTDKKYDKALYKTNLIWILTDSL